MTSVAFSVHVLIGIFLFGWIDRWEMSKQIPYDRMPSGYPLSCIRISGLIVYVLFGTWFLLRDVARLIFEKETSHGSA